MKYIRHTRINFLTSKALTGKYTWNDLTKLALKMGISKPTANSYIDEVEERLKSRGLLIEV